MRELGDLKFHYGTKFKFDATGLPAVIATIVASLTFAGVVAFLVWRWYG